jgi:hypothetical protein
VVARSRNGRGRRLTSEQVALLRERPRARRRPAGPELVVAAAVGDEVRAHRVPRQRRLRPQPATDDRIGVRLVEAPVLRDAERATAHHDGAHGATRSIAPGCLL